MYVDYEDVDGAKIKREANSVPLEQKRQIFDLYVKYVKTKKWKFSTLQSKYASIITDCKCVRRWEKQVDQGGSKFDKYSAIE